MMIYELEVLEILEIHELEVLEIRSPHFHDGPRKLGPYEKDLPSTNRVPRLVNRYY